MKSRPLITVIIPCFNGARYLAEAIDSVLTQSYDNIELVVVDDGSTDTSAEIVARYPMVRCIRQNNAGVAAARNTGLQHSTGEYVAFLDQDDRLLPNAIESNLNCLLEQPHCAFSFGDALRIDSAGTPMSDDACRTSRTVRRSSSPHEGTDHYISLLRGSYIWTTGAVLYRRGALVAASGFDPRISPAADTDLHLRIARTYPVCHNDSIVVEKRRHGDNQSWSNALLLRSEITVLRWQMRWALSNYRAIDALQQGMRFYTALYGKRLIRQMISDLRLGRNWRQILSGAFLLVQCAAILVAVSACRLALRLGAAGVLRRSGSLVKASADPL